MLVLNHTKQSLNICFSFGELINEESIFLLGRPKEKCYKYLITHVGSLIYYLDSNVVFKEDRFSLF